MTADRETLTCELRCDYIWRRTDRWIDFPWSTLPPVVRRSDRQGH